MEAQGNELGTALLLALDLDRGDCDATGALTQVHEEMRGIGAWTNCMAALVIGQVDCSASQAIQSPR